MAVLALRLRVRREVADIEHGRLEAERMPAEDHADYDCRAGNKREQRPVGGVISPMFAQIDTWKAFSAEQI